LSPQPYLPLYVGEFLATTATWNGEERALLLLLLALSWTAPLPAELNRLAKICSYDTRRFKALWQTVSQQFQDSAHGLINPRVEELREHASRLHLQRAEASRRGVEARDKSRQRAPAGVPSGVSNGEPTGIRHGTSIGEPSGVPFMSGQDSKDPSQPFPTPDGARKGAPSRTNGTNPRNNGRNPRALGTNKRAVRNRSLAAWTAAKAAIDSVKDTERTWADVPGMLNDPIADRAIERAGGHRRIADCDQYTTSMLQSAFRRAYEQECETSPASAEQRT